MKKFVLTVLLFSLIATVPSYGMKIITNTQLDRTVPSRCSGPGAEAYVDQFQDTVYKGTTGSTVIKNGYREGWGYQGYTYEKYYRPLVSNGIRPELIGTTWNYPAYSEVNAGTDPKNVVTTNTIIYKDHQLKRYMREAADYYVIDTINSPETAVQVGYDVNNN